MVTLMGQRPSAEMADRAEAVLAVLSCACAEVLWWFQHWEEVRHFSLHKLTCPPAVTRSKDGQEVVIDVLIVYLPHQMVALLMTASWVHRRRRIVPPPVY